MFKRAFFILICLVALFGPAYGKDEQMSLPKLTIFYSPACHRCVEVKAGIMPYIEKEFRVRVEIEYLDIGLLDNYKLMLGLMEKYGQNIDRGVPLFYMNGAFLSAKDLTREKLEGFIFESLGRYYKEEGFVAIDLISYFKGFAPLAVTGAGLIDGINPCAFTVIVFFISFLAVQGYKKRELLGIGFSFIFAVFVTYLLLGLGIFNFLYRLEGFWLLTRVINISIGVFSIILGVLAVCDFIKFKKTKDTQGLFLQLPQSVKTKIHYVIGLHYRRKQAVEAKEDRPQKHILKLALTALLTGFLVSLLEAVCTGQTYLPTISFILKTAPLKIEALGYLLLYNLMFIVPLLIIFLFALLGVTSQQFSDFLKKRLLIIKALMAIVFFGLGAFLIWKA